MNKSSVRRALTTLKKNGVIKCVDVNTWSQNGEVVITVVVPAELTHPKKRTLKTKKVIQQLPTGIGKTCFMSLQLKTNKTN